MPFYLSLNMAKRNLEKNELCIIRGTILLKSV